jgi:hypothetical protein
MKISNVALVSAMSAFCLVAVGCRANADNDSEGSLAANESQLVADNDEIDDVDEMQESAIEEPLSGADPSDPGTPADGADDATVASKVKTNVGKWFKPAGCIATTIAGNVATHVFSDCTGPYGFVHFTGTITSTYVLADGALTVTHEATGFKANGAELSGKRVIVYTKAGSVITRQRTGTWTGTTKNGRAFSHDADFTATWDPSTKCVSRDGHAETSVANREFTRTIDGYKRCGIGSLGCPVSGEIVLERTKGSDTASVTVDFLGGRDFTVTGPRGHELSGKLTCNP